MFDDGLEMPLMKMSERVEKRRFRGWREADGWALSLSLSFSLSLSLVN